METGRFWRCDASGWIQNDAAAELIRGEYLPVLQDIVAAYSAILNSAVASIYLTGSVARGLSRVGSDLDCFAVLKPNQTRSADFETQLDAQKDILKAKYPWIKKFDLEVWQAEELLPNGNGFSICAFIVQVHSVLLFGEDLSKQLPRFSLSLEVAAEDVRQIREDITEAIDETNSDPSANNVRYWAVRISKNIIRACFGLIMMDLGLFTRDISLCAKSYLKYRPEREAHIAILIDQIEHPTESKLRLHEILTENSHWLLLEAKAWESQMRIVHPDGLLSRRT